MEADEAAVEIDPASRRAYEERALASARPAKRSKVSARRLAWQAVEHRSSAFASRETVMWIDSGSRTQAMAPST